MSPNSTQKEIPKSTSPASTDEIGTTSRGKYTFLIRFWLPTRLFADSLSAYANSCHGSSAVYANTGYGTPSDGTFASRPKNTLNTTIVKNGCRIAHAAPSAVCLYRTFTSR